MSRLYKLWPVGLLLLTFLLGSVGVAFAASTAPGDSARNLPSAPHGDGTSAQDPKIGAQFAGAAPALPRRIVATIVELNEDTLTLSLRSGRQVDVHTDDNTRFLVPGVAEAGIADLQPGDTVAVLATPGRNDEPPYAAVVTVLRGADGGWRVVRGRLTAIDGTTLRVTLRAGRSVQLQTDRNTRFFVRGVDGATLEDLHVGYTIGAQFVEREDGAFYASAIAARRALFRPRPGTALGRIDNIDGDIISLATRRGRISVLTDSHTVFRRQGGTTFGIADLKTGQIIGVGGHWEEDGSLHARIVGARFPQPGPLQGERQSP